MSDNVKEDLNLLLIYLTGWEEDKKNAPGQKVFRAWKGFRFDILNELEKQRLIYQIPGGKSLILTDEGKKRVEQLKRKYLAFMGNMNPPMNAGPVRPSMSA